MEKTAAGSLDPTISNDVGDVQEVHMERGFGLWGLITLGWNIINIFGGLSLIFVVGFSAGGVPSIFYGLYDPFCVDHIEVSRMDR